MESVESAGFSLLWSIVDITPTFTVGGRLSGWTVRFKE